MKNLLIILLLAYLPHVHGNSIQKTIKLKPAIQKATNYQKVDDISQYWISEKLDGIRGYWNGKQLKTRQGNIIHTPVWFTQHWPNITMDGELWMGRNKFQQTLSCVRKTHIDDNCWQKVRFMIFDLPEHKGDFSERINKMKAITAKNPSHFLAMIKQFKATNITEVEYKLNIITDNLGEGLMLHQENAFYKAGRTRNILKLKKHQDAEAKVIAHYRGKGKYRNMLGAMQVKTPQGIVFKIGSGFTDKERVDPPAIGSIITYQYNGTTTAGIPRFARFLRVREDITTDDKNITNAKH